MDKTLFWAAFLSWLLLVSVVQTTAQSIVLEVQIDGAVPAVVPEGIEYFNGRFLIGSLASNSLFSVQKKDTSQTAEAELFFNGTGFFTGSVGLHVDGTDLYVSSGLFPPAAYGAGIILHDIEASSPSLSGPFDFSPFYSVGTPNDVVSTPSRDSYWTETINGMVFKVSAQGTTTLFTSGGLLAPQAQGEFGANGIEYFRGGDGTEYLLVGRAASTNGALIRIPINSPSSTHQVTYPGTSRNLAFGADGLFFHSSGDLFLADNPTASVRRLRSSDDLLTAELVEERSFSFNPPQVLTTITIDSDDHVWGLYPGNFDPTQPNYIVRFDFVSAAALMYASSLLCCMVAIVFLLV